MRARTSGGYVAACAAVTWQVVLVCAQLLLMAALLYFVTAVALPYHTPAQHSSTRSDSTEDEAAAVYADVQNSALLWRAAQLHIALAAVTYALLRYVVVAPFGRHARADLSAALSLPAHTAWLLQEVPTLLNVIYFVVCEQQRQTTTTTATTTAAAATAAAMAASCYNDSGNIRYVVGCVWRQRVVAAIARVCATCRPGLLLFVLHYVQRSFVYPLRLRAHARRVPLHVVWAATLYCTFNGRLQTLANAAPHASQWQHSNNSTTIRQQQQDTVLSSSTVARLVTVVGVVLFVAGLLVNIAADATLTSLKRQSATYHIPRGWLFDHVSCPNYLGEMVEWCGYALVVAGTTAATAPTTDVVRTDVLLLSSSSSSTVLRLAPTLCAVSFVVYVAANLLPRAAAHHAWYVATFGDAYTRLGRRIIVPYLY